MVPPGRLFLQRMIVLTKGIQKPHYHVRQDNGFTEDLKMWQRFIENWNETNLFMNEEWEDSSTLALYTDASGTEGFGVSIELSGSREDGSHTKPWRQKVLVLTGRSCMPSLSSVQYGRHLGPKKVSLFDMTTSLWKISLILNVQKNPKLWSWSRTHTISITSQFLFQSETRWGYSQH